ncbi:cytosine permease [Fulvimarina endophytica]|uniref:Cytosine permease n=1 Tax=Fulvimarina endophytica TaxID=2293836 RepID=A0A371X5E7_9HYPH|nr:cytosine permease [Fulvimarina endophytica]RFC64450.1 cytosine permease [Fulvimarina endophytica]
MSTHPAAPKPNEDYPLSEVPMGDRKSFWSLAIILLGFTFFTATMFAGGQIGTAFPFWPDLVLVIFAGNLLLGLYVAVLSHIGFKTGLNTALLSRFGFGRIGARLSDLLLGFTQIAWYGWGTATIAVVLLRMAGADPDQSPLMLNGLIVFFGLAFCLTAYVGYRGLELLSIVAVPAILVLLALSIVLALRDAGGIAGLASGEPTTSLGIGAAIAIVFGTFVSGGTQATNWTRFAAKSSHAVGGAFLAFFIGNGLMVATGAIGALVYQQPDVVDVLVLQGLTLFGIAMLFLNLWTTQDNTIYNFSVVGCAAFATPRRRLVTVIGALIGTGLALMRIDLHLVPFLLALGTFIPPIGGVIMADFFVRHRGRYPALATAAIPAFNWPGLAAYAIGCVAGLVSPGVPPVNAILAAFLAYWLLDRLIGTKIDAVRPERVDR